MDVIFSDKTQSMDIQYIGRGVAIVDGMIAFDPGSYDLEDEGPVLESGLASDETNSGASS